MSDNQKYLIKIINDLFLVSATTFFLFYGIEGIKTGLISNYFDLNILPIISVASFIILIKISKNFESLDSSGKFLNQLVFVILFSFLIFFGLHLSILLKIFVIILFFIISIQFIIKTNK